MTTGRQIAEERFAKGEITSEEYDKIVSKLDASQPTPKIDEPSSGLQSEPRDWAQRFDSHQTTPLFKVGNVLFWTGLVVFIFLVWVGWEDGLNSLGDILVILAMGVTALGGYIVFGLVEKE